ncbi:hypothetical protein BEN49_13140 [Hymenobacter coccineus]|uniref:Uncharacterized protein n=1 Tax=Hymenobacter coccineus TaxID=1908235 RepID=A0A1G1SWB1_9BACT|nr:hypothetical protein BEN49_13140 [Hymenobacter coccineus]
MLKELLTQGHDARIFTNCGFHPKLYLLRKGTKYNAFLGSSNGTANGLFHNVELNAMLDEQAACKELLRWFKATGEGGKRITESFLKSYKPLQQQRRSEAEQVDNEQKGLQTILDDNDALVQAIQKLRRKGRRYNELCASRQEDLKQLRTSLDFPRFKKLDLESFMRNPSLGTVMGFNRPKIRQNVPGFTLLLRFLYRRRNTSIAATVDTALGPDYKLEGVSTASITKLLTIIDPERFCSWNKRSGGILGKLGYEIERGTSLGQKYERLCNVLKSVAEECDVEDLAVLDLCLIEVEGTH